jgi:membrane protease YdiL (CAAX protease family)
VTAHPAIVLLLIVVNSFFEEIVVTGYVVSALAKHGAAFAISASTLLRFLYHTYQGPLGTLSILPMGLLYAAVFWRWRNLWPMLVAHSIMNSFSLLGSP